MEVLRITTPEGRVYDMPNQASTRNFYERANSLKKGNEIKYKIEVVIDEETPSGSVDVAETEKEPEPTGGEVKKGRPKNQNQA